MRIVNYRGRWTLVTRDARGRKRAALGYAATDENRPAAEREARRILRESAQPVEAHCQAIWDAYIADTQALSTARMKDAWKALGPTFGHLEPKDVTRALCREYAAKRREAGRQNSTVRSELIYLRAALRWADPRTPAVFDMPAPAAPADRYLTRAQFAKLLAAADDTFHLKTFLHLAIATAARKEAILSLRWEQVNWDAGTIWLGEKPSGKKRATVPMTAALRAILEEGHKIKGKAKTIVNWEGNPVTTLRRSLRRAATAAGVPWATPHVLRHSAAVWLAEAGHSMDEIAQYLGHSDSRITARVYARYSPDHLRRLAGSLEVGETVTGGSHEPADREQN